MNLKNRHFLKLLDFTPEEITTYLDLAAELKDAKKAGREIQRMKGKNIALIFEKTSTRTRCAFEVAARDQGADATYLEPSASQIGHKESIKDTARVLGRMYDAIEYRGFAQETVEELAKYAGVPVFNGLTNEFHPTQMLADALTMREHSGKPLNQTAFAYVGDARYNMGNSLLILGAKLGMDVRIGAPQSLWPSEGIIAAAHAAAKETGAKITLTENAHEAVKGVGFIHTDVWVSMGEPKEVWQERIDLLKDYRVTPELMAASGNPQVNSCTACPPSTTAKPKSANGFTKPSG